MLAPLRVDDCMLRAEELLERDGLTDARVVAAHDADIFVAEEPLLKEPRFLKIREIAQGEIGRPGFERLCGRMSWHGHSLDPCTRSMGGEMVEKLRQKVDFTDIRGEQMKLAIGAGWIEGGRWQDFSPYRFHHQADRLNEFGRSRCRMHFRPRLDEQGVSKQRAQPVQGGACCGLAQADRVCGTGNTAVLDRK